MLRKEATEKRCVRLRVSLILANSRGVNIELVELFEGLCNILKFEREIYEAPKISTEVKRGGEREREHTQAKMLYSAKPPLIIPLFFLLASFISGNLSLSHNSESIAGKGRTLMGIKETPNGGNVTYDCSPSGPCIPCLRSEKSDKKYHCGETGYRIRLKCVPSGPVSKDSKKTKAHKKRSTLESTELGDNHPNGELSSSLTRQRRILGDPSKSGPSFYVTYRSCLPAVNEEKLSVFGFESLMLGLLASSGSFIYFRKKRASMPGGVPVRLPTSSRF